MRFFYVYSFNDTVKNCVEKWKEWFKDTLMLVCYLNTCCI